MLKQKNISGWESILSSSITKVDQLPAGWSIDRYELRQVIDSYPMRINPYYFHLIKSPDDAIGKQVVPDVAEIQNQSGSDDPLSEENQSPIPNLIHRYPDRVVLLASNRCAIYCRFCLRKRNIDSIPSSRSGDFGACIDYIQKHKHIREVILSGGDPLLLSTMALHTLLSDIRRISNVEVVRIHTRVPCALPQRITENLVRMLASFHPLYINTHFNHPGEITPQAASACNRLTDSGIPVGCQTVLLKGINDDPEIMAQLMHKLLKMRVRPYYIHQLDQIRGTCHFSTSLDQGLSIIDSLRGHISGMGVPQYMIDLPGGGGKVPLLPEYVKKRNSRGWLIRNFEGDVFEYPLIDRT